MIKNNTAALIIATLDHIAGLLAGPVLILEILYMIAY